MQIRLLTCFLMLVATLIAGCAESTSQASSTPLPASGTPPAQQAHVLPSFSDWRVAYLGQDGRIHAVSLDATSDVAGPLLPGLTSPSLHFASAGLAPNGHALAYDAPDLNILELTAQSSGATSVKLAVMDQLTWSPDSRRLVVSDGLDAFYTVDVASGQATVIPRPHLSAPWKALTAVVGWLDLTHVAVQLVRDGPYYTAPDDSTYSTGVALGALDLSTGHVRVIASMTFPGLANPWFSVSPDGTRALFFNTRFRDNPFTPEVVLIDTQTGQQQRLPGIVTATHAGFSAVAWRPGTNQLAASTGFAENGDVQTWLLDIEHDTATRLVGGVYAAKWAPNAGPLIVSTGRDLEIGAGPYTISALTIQSDGSVATKTLTREAWTFPCIGFVRTAA